MHNRIKELRAGQDLSQLELAQKVGVRRETIVFLEKGKCNPSLRLAHDIAKSFGLAIEAVFLFDDEADKAKGEPAA
ncbi:MAG: helix-turn-helix transcriptional regulator [Candidatus Moduliflexus flocculans]|nr:helix-turn-helix transcriptional regulator [Candidatus Moduliflexus flocculans]